MEVHSIFIFLGVIAYEHTLPDIYHTASFHCGRVHQVYHACHCVTEDAQQYVSLVEICCMLCHEFVPAMLLITPEKEF